MVLKGNKSELVERTFLFVKSAHGAIDQRRKYTGEPYIRHPVAVASIVSEVPHTEAMLAAALLHDTVEDTEISTADIEREFGVEVVELVAWLTDVSRLEDGNRSVRKAIDREHIARATAEAKTIKLADLIDNSRTFVACAPKFAAVYLQEKALLLEVLKEGDESLWLRANEILQSGLRSLAGC
ncbi:HD domain-containing protein [Microbulbifer sp. 2201CG32-9]|uniref:HD domain-containing protein n=1 Tax=Microbulbifer sp. 2201CG32-9 TaxID=3232309 RepID=UPI00345B9619